MPSLDHLDAFLYELKRNEFNIGVGEFLRARALVARLHASGRLPQTWEELGPWLAPIVCVTAESQQAFRKHLARWAKSAPSLDELLPAECTKVSPSVTTARGIDGDDSKRPDKVAQEQAQSAARKARRSGRLATAVAGGVLLPGVLVAGFLASDPTLPGDKPPVAVAPAPEWPVLPAALVEAIRSPPDRVPFLLVLWTIGLTGVALWRGRQSVLERRFTARRPESERVRLTTRSAAAFSAPLLRRGLQSLRLHRRIPSRQLHMRRSVSATLRAGGVLTAAFGHRPVLPEYLFVAARPDPRNQHFDLALQLMERLREEHIPLIRFEHVGDLRRVVRHGAGGQAEHLDIDDLVDRYPGHRLLIVDDASRLVDEETGTAAAWLDQISEFELRVLVTPLPVREWGWREKVLEQAGFVVLPLAEDGLMALARFLQQGGEGEPPSLTSVPTDERDGAQFPSLLKRTPTRWLARRAPRDAECERLARELRDYLDGPGFEWLCSLAVYPRIHPELTRHLGGTLKDADDNPVFDDDRLLALSRLPWLRHARMPDWLRLRLLRELSEDRREAAREALTTVLLSSDYDRRGFDMEIVPRHGQGFLDALLAAARRAPPSSPLRERIFLGYMSGRLLEVDAPPGLDERFGRSRVLWSVLGASGLLASIALWLVYPEQGLRPWFQQWSVAQWLAATLPAQIPRLSSVTGLLAAGGALLWFRTVSRRQVMRGEGVLDAGFAALLVFWVLVAVVVGALGASPEQNLSAGAKEIAPGQSNLSLVFANIGLLALTLGLRLFAARPAAALSHPSVSLLFSRPLPWVPMSLIVALAVGFMDTVITMPLLLSGNEVDGLRVPWVRITDLGVGATLGWAIVDTHGALRVGIIAVVVFSLLKGVLKLSVRQVALIVLAASLGRLYAAFLGADLAVTLVAAGPVIGPVPAQFAREWASGTLALGSIVLALSVPLSVYKVVRFAPLVRAGVFFIALLTVLLGAPVVTPLARGFIELGDAMLWLVQLAAAEVLTLALLWGARRHVGGAPVALLVGVGVCVPLLWMLLYVPPAIVAGVFIALEEIFLDNGATPLMLSIGPTTFAMVSVAGLVGLGAAQWDVKAVSPDDRASLVPWLWVPLMFFLSFSHQWGFNRLDQAYLLIPIAAWLGYRYGPSAFAPVAVGGLWLLPPGYLFSQGTEVPSYLDAYLVMLLVCRVFANPGWLFERVKDFMPTRRVYLILYVAMPLVLYIGAGVAGGQLNLDFGLYDLVRAGWLMLGLSALRFRRFWPLLALVVVVGIAMRVLGVHALPAIGPVSIYYWLTSPRFLIEGLAFFACGRWVRYILEGSDYERSARNLLGVAVALTACMVFSLVRIRLNIPDLGIGFGRGTGLSLLGPSRTLAYTLSFVVGLAFAAAGTWLTAFVAVSAMTIALAIASSVYPSGLSWGAESGLRLSLRAPQDFASAMNIAIIGVAFAATGSSVAKRLEGLRRLYILGPEGVSAPAGRLRESQPVTWFNGVLSRAMAVLVVLLGIFLVLSLFADEGAEVAAFTVPFLVAAGILYARLRAKRQLPDGWEDGRRVTGEAVPWWYLVLFIVLGLRVAVSGPTLIYVADLLVLLSAWLGHRYGRAGSVAVAWAGLVLPVGFEMHLGPLSVGTWSELDLYIVCLVIAKVFESPERFRALIDDFEWTLRRRILVFVVFGMSFYLRAQLTDTIGLEVGMYQTALYGSAVLMGLARVPIGRVAGIATVVVGLAVLVRTSDVPSFSFAGGSSIYPGLSMPVYLALVLGFVGCGRLIRRLLDEPKLIRSLDGYFVPCLLAVTGLLFLRYGFVRFESDAGSTVAVLTTLRSNPVLWYLAAFCLGWVFGRRAIVGVLAAAIGLWLLTFGFLTPEGTEWLTRTWKTPLLSFGDLELVFRGNNAFRCAGYGVIALAFTFFGERVGTLVSAGSERKTGSDSSSVARPSADVEAAEGETPTPGAIQS